MSLTLESVNKARVAQGMEPLEKLATDTTPAGAHENKDEKPELNEDGTPKDKKKEEKNEVGELTDQQLIELLGKRGIKAASLDELKPKPEGKTPEQIQEEKESAKLTFGLTKGLFNKKEYENFITDSSSKEAVVFAQYHAEAIADDPTLTEKEVQEEFREKFGLDAEVGSRKHKRGAKEIEVIAKEILTTKYGKIYEADKKFADHEQETSKTAAYNQNILSKAPEYKKNIDEAFDALKVINGVEMPPESIKEIKDRFLTQEFIENQINNGVNKEQISNQTRAAIITKNIDYILQKSNENALREKAAGTRGIPPPGEKKKETVVETQLSDNQKKYIEELRQRGVLKPEQN